MVDKVTESDMSDTEVCIMSDTQHKLVILQVNSEELYVYTPEIARTLGTALINAANKVEPKIKEEPKPAAVPVAVKTA